MTTELEKQFFDTFGIEPEEEKFCLWECKEPSLEHVPCDKECKYQRHNIYYPEITDRHYLELLVTIINKWGYFTEAKHKTEINEFKEQLLKDVMFLQTEKVITPEEVLKQQVQAIFEGEN